MERLYLKKYRVILTVDSSTVICWKSPFVIVGVSDLFCCFILFLLENPVSKQWRP